jgi:hypothetical protein
MYGTLYAFFYSIFIILIGNNLELNPPEFPSEAYPAFISGSVVAILA